MGEFLQLMTLPFLACLLLAGIHVYLGIHVLARKVIFVDLALAQIAALGAIYGILLGYNSIDAPFAIKGFSLLFAVIGAAVFSLTRMRHERVPQEAIIGITYAVALSAAILASAHLPHGADELRELLSGSILWVDAKTIVYTAILYSAVGLFHYVFRRQLLLISLSPDLALSQGINIRFWDFLFYVSFGFVVTSSVTIAGVLLVFCYLIIPAVVAVLLADSLKNRLIVGWIVGALVSFVGVVLSYVQDLPSGPTIVVSFAAFLTVVATILSVTRSASPARQLLKVLIVLSLAAGALYVTLSLHRHEDHLPVVKIDENEITLSQYHSMLEDQDDNIRERAIRGIRKFGQQDSIRPLIDAIASESDDYIRVEMAEALLELGDARGIPVLIDVMDKGEAQQVRQDAHEHLTAHTLVHLPFAAENPAAANDHEVGAFQRWWKTNQHQLRWQVSTKKFVLE